MVYDFSHDRRFMKKKLKEGTKFDTGKPDWSLLPLDAVEEVVKVMDMGAKKYARNNWQQMQDINRYRAAMMRHMKAEQSGESTDPESGLPHIAHVACNAIFLVWFELRRREQVLMHKFIQKNIIQIRKLGGKE